MYQRQKTPRLTDVDGAHRNMSTTLERQNHENKTQRTQEEKEGSKRDEDANERYRDEKASEQKRHNTSFVRRSERPAHTRTYVRFKVFAWWPDHATSLVTDLPSKAIKNNNNNKNSRNNNQHETRIGIR